jgi:ATP-dependent helicase/nuclease subunit A
LGCGDLRQLALYRGLVAALYPDRPEEAALLWTDLPDLMPIQTALLDEALARRVGLAKRRVLDELLQQRSK